MACTEIKIRYGSNELIFPCDGILSMKDPPMILDYYDKDEFEFDVTTEEDKSYNSD